MADFSSTPENRTRLQQALDAALAHAEAGEVDLRQETRELIAAFSGKASRARSGLTNIITGLAATVADAAVDPRYHRPEKDEGMPSPPPGRKSFTGRGLSETVVYPWLNAHRFRYANSGWQTRTFERPRPYTLDYPENIGIVKEEFLSILDLVASGTESPLDVLAEILSLEISLRDRRDLLAGELAKLADPDDWTIAEILEALEKHMQGAGASRLPVLALQAIYEVIMPAMDRFNSKRLVELEEHSAADVRTGSIADVVVKDEDDDDYEAVEVKHLLPISDQIVITAAEKIRQSTVSRYYILTTGDAYGSLTPAAWEEINRVKAEHGCQVILNGVLPTIKYYLRLVPQPGEFITAYERLLETDPKGKVEHLEAWIDLRDNG